ncbi:MAG: nicotinate phosphoribosyltransferase [Planctomycetes bacterium]|nr:nicotinate phosphoribosyltransferase [Planctomycetota bacterium]
MDSAPLLTDLYQLTMAYGYWQTGRAEHEAVFHLHFRKSPFAGGYAVAAGLEPALDWLRSFRFSADDCAYLATLTGNDGKPLFPPAFIAHLGALRLSVDIDAIPEGTVVFPHQPLVRVRGPILQCQLLETALLCLVNFQSLIATKAARICQAARGEPVLEFGLRRAQGFDGALGASRAAYVGGCASTSNVLAGRRFGIPVRGTHAHSWVMSFADEPEAFAAYAAAMPNNCVFLVDTYDTLEGVRHAIAAGRALRARGHELVGIRLDSGDLAWLSIEARRLLDEAGFPQAAIVASNDLDERTIASIKDQGDWQPRVKLSEQAVKVSTPGMQNVRRFVHGGEAVGDVIWDELHPRPGQWTMVDPADPTRHKDLPADAAAEDLLVPVLRAGAAVYTPPPLAAVRARTQAQLALFHPGIKRFDNPHQYPVGLEQGLHARKTALILAARGRKG